MATRKQTAANRRNAQKSTGPRTEAGKARSAQNAVTHGLTARAATLPDEDAAEYAAFADGVRADLAPLGMLEQALAARVAEGMWRLLRASRIEAACFAYELAQASERAARLREIPGLPPSASHGEEHALGTAFLKLDADGLPNSLARYEAAIQRGVERGLKLLQDTRKLRAAAEKAAPRDEPVFPAAQAGQGFPADAQAGGQPAGHTDGRAGAQVAEEPGGEPASRAGGQAAGQTAGQPREQAGSQPAKAAVAGHGAAGEASAAAAAPQAPVGAAARQASWDECPETQRANWDPWPEARPNVIGPGYEPARPGERIEHRRHGNTRYIVRVPIED